MKKQLSMNERIKIGILYFLDVFQKYEKLERDNRLRR